MSVQATGTFLQKYVIRSFNNLATELKKFVDLLKDKNPAMQGNKLYKAANKIDKILNSYFNPDNIDSSQMSEKRKEKYNAMLKAANIIIIQGLMFAALKSGRGFTINENISNFKYLLTELDFSQPKHWTKNECVSFQNTVEEPKYMEAISKVFNREDDVLFADHTFNFNPGAVALPHSSLKTLEISNYNEDKYPLPKALRLLFGSIPAMIILYNCQ